MGTVTVTVSQYILIIGITLLMLVAFVFVSARRAFLKLKMLSRIPLSRTALLRRQRRHLPSSVRTEIWRRIQLDEELIRAKPHPLRYLQWGWALLGLLWAMCEHAILATTEGSNIYHLEEQPGGMRAVAVSTGNGTEGSGAVHVTHVRFKDLIANQYFYFGLLLGQLLCPQIGSFIPRGLPVQSAASPLSGRHRRDAFLTRQCAPTWHHSASALTLMRPSARTLCASMSRPALEPRSARAAKRAPSSSAGLRSHRPAFSQ